MGNNVPIPFHNPQQTGQVSQYDNPTHQATIPGNHSYQRTEGVEPATGTNVPGKRLARWFLMDENTTGSMIPEKPLPISGTRKINEAKCPICKMPWRLLNVKEY
jgi:hypothetical protein